MTPPVERGALGMERKSSATPRVDLHSLTGGDNTRHQERIVWSDPLLVAHTIAAVHEVRTKASLGDAALSARNR